MSRKKEASTILSTEDNDQIQHLLERYQDIADNLHRSTKQAEAEAVLTPISTLSEAVQLAFLKALAKENTVDAADVLVAMNALSPNKEARKEARRSLIRLEASRVSPQWTPPIIHTPAVQVKVANPPRFWKGFVTLMREEGEVQLALSWEQGYDYSEARALVFLLDYWREGVKDVIVEAGSKRHVNEYLQEMRRRLETVPVVDCTLAEGKRLLEEALSVNEWRALPPHKDYRLNLPTINNLIMQATDLGEDLGSTFINPELEDQEVVINFLGAWSMGDYGLAYDLLTNGSAVRANLSRDEWIELHRNWANEALPVRMELGFVHERERSQSALWVPTSISSRSSARKEIEVGWSLELADTPLSGTLKEMPMGTAINKETGRHWFWTNYTLVREQNAWRIQQATDEGATIQGLSIPELQRRIKEYEDTIEERVNQPDKDPQEFAAEMSWRLTQLMHYYDALIARLPLDRLVNEDAYQRSILLGNPERMAVYLERLAQRFPENRADIQRRLGATLAELAYKYDQGAMKERREHLLAQAEARIREAVAADNSATSHILLAELLINQDHHEEAQSELQTALALNPSRNDEATIEAAIGNIAMRQERMAEAISHFQRVIEIRPDYPGAWFSLGLAQRLLGRLTEAEESYIRSLQMEPGDIRAYSELIAIAMNQGDKQKARTLAEQGVQANPNSAHLHALLSSVLFELGDQRGAQRQIELAEAIDPELEIVQGVRQYMQKAKKKP
ncbi:MAG TPA: tetratricopeptide repeat protein [Ktedonosporobacter sp.]|nr:tetratricopeptide repeat protein [Ktedonosporobacter sp.]